MGFFLFAPTLTCMGIRNCCKVVTGVVVTYANGASVNTSFRDQPRPRSGLQRARPALRAGCRDRAPAPREGQALPKYEYPDEC